MKFAFSYKLLLIIIILFSFCVKNSIYAQNTYFVKTTNSGSGDGSSWQNASSNLGEIINNANEGSKIYLEFGEYNSHHFNAASDGESSLIVNKNIQLYGGFNGELTHQERQMNGPIPWDFKHITLIKGNAGKRVIALDGGGVIDGVTIENGDFNGDGGGAYITGSTLRNSVIQNNKAKTGAGVFVAQGGRVEHSIIINNQTFEHGDPGALTGGGVVVADNDGQPVDGCFIINNKSRDQGGGIYFQGTGSVLNSVIANNEAIEGGVGRGGGAFFSQPGKLINCTVARNKSGSFGAGIMDVGHGGHIYNTVFWHNGSTNEHGIANEGVTSYDFRNYASWGDFEGAHPTINFHHSDANNCFVAPTNSFGNIPGLNKNTIGNWQLKPTSPLVDRGDNSLNSTQYDIAKNNRHNGSGGVIDIGAYEMTTVIIHNITIKNLIWDYDGAPKQIAVTLPYEVSYKAEYSIKNQNNFSENKPVNAGDYDVRVTITEPGYIGSETAQMKINKRNLTLSLGAITKTYNAKEEIEDFNKSNIIINNIVSGDDVKVKSFSTAKYNTQHAGNNKVATVSGIQLEGADINNYNYPTEVSNSNSVINKMSITITAKANQFKTYDKNGNNPASIQYEATALPAGDYYEGSLSRGSNENVGTYQITQGTLSPVTPGLHPKDGNYTIIFNSNNFKIDAKTLTISSITVDNKVYDATTEATISNAVLSGIVNGDNVSYSVGANFDNKNVGNNKNVTATFQLEGSDKDNYQIQQPSNLKANITKRELYLDGFAIASKEPAPGNKIATISNWGDLKVIPDSDNGKVEIDKDGVTAAFPSDAAGEYVVDVSTISLKGDEKDNYTLAQPTEQQRTAKILTTDAEFGWPLLVRVYNGEPQSVIVKELHNNKDADVEYYYLGAWQNQAPKNAGTYQVKATSTDPTYPGDEEKELVINKMPITITATEGQHKIYDKDTNNPSEIQYTATSLPVGDSYSGKLSRVNNENVGEHDILIGSLKPVTPGVSPDDSNYDVTFISDKFTIRKRNITISDIVVDRKEYDANDVAVVSQATLNGVVDGDIIGYDVVATFENKNVGENKDVDTSFELTGANKDNYALVAPGKQRADIVARKLILDGFKIASRDAEVDNRAATIEEWGELKTIPTPDIGKVYVDKDNVTAFFDDEVAGEYFVNVSEIKLLGDERHNYVLIQPSAEERKATINSGVAIFDWATLEREYNSQNQHVYVTETHYNSVANVEYYYSDSGLWSNEAPKNAGSYQVKATSVDATYIGSEEKTFIISPKELVAATFDNGTKVYDNTTVIASQPEIKLTGIFTNDLNTIYAEGDNAYFEDKNAGANKKVIIENIVLKGENGSNYTIPSVAENNNWTITKANYLDIPLLFSFSNQAKMFDGTVAVIKNGENHIPEISITGFYENDVFTAVANKAEYDSPESGQNKVVTLSEITYSNNALDNYILPEEVINEKSSIDKYVIPEEEILSKISVEQQNKVYDGTVNIKDDNNNVYIPQIVISRLVDGYSDIQALAGNASYESKDAGENKQIVLSNIKYSGNDAENYNLPKTIIFKGNSISKKPIVIKPAEKQKFLFNDENIYIDFDVTPKTLDSGTPIYNEIVGELSWEGGLELGMHLINRGTITDANNLNYDISFVDDVYVEIDTDIEIVLKWDYMLLVDNSSELFVAYQWYKNGEKIPGATNQYFANSDKSLCGYYKCEVTLSDGSKFMLPEYNYTIGCDNLKSLNIYPNPVKTSSSIFIEDNIHEDDIYIIEIYTTDGSLIHKEVRKFSDTKLELISPTTSGVYLVTVIKNGSIEDTYKLIVTN